MGADDPAQEFRAAQRTIQMQLKAKRTDVRVAAVRKLAAFPLVDAARMLVQYGLASPDDEVHRAAYETLLKFKADKDICRCLQETIETRLEKGHGDREASGALGVLLASDSADAVKAAQSLLERVSRAGKSGLPVLVLLADDLGSQADEIGLRGLLKLMQLPPFPVEFSLRRAIVQNLAGIRKREAIGALLSILPSAAGEVRADIVQHLTGVSGQRLGLETQAWTDWWQANQPRFEFPPAGQGQTVARAALSPTAIPSYYGLPLYGTRIVFVMDTSLSMRGARIQAAKRELLRAIGTLPPGVEFNVLVFNTRVSSWQRQLVPSTPENQQAAALFVAAQELGWNTATYEALEVALAWDAESIYLLTDGAPDGGKIGRPAQIVAAVSQSNRVRRVTINSIGIGVGPPGSDFDNFLRSLSARNFGEYHRVDH
jgi:hypothetical protein